jgi:hypothetical protein
MQELSKTVKSQGSQSSSWGLCPEHFEYEARGSFNHSAQFLVVHGDKYLFFNYLSPPIKNSNSIDKEETWNYLILILYADH